MTSETAEGASRGLEAAGVRTRRVPAADFHETIDEVVDGPAVGVELTEYPVSLSETAVTVDPTPAELKRATVGVTPASTCIADYGSLVLSSTADGAELVSLFVDSHVVVLDEDGIVQDMQTAFEEFAADEETASESRILATGPSATADMGALVEGAHGPKDVTAILLTGD